MGEPERCESGNAGGPRARPGRVTRLLRDIAGGKADQAYPELRALLDAEVRTFAQKRLDKARRRGKVDTGQLLDDTYDKVLRLTAGRDTGRGTGEFEWRCREVFFDLFCEMIPWAIVDILRRESPNRGATAFKNLLREYFARPDVAPGLAAAVGKPDDLGRALAAACGGLARFHLDSSAVAHALVNACAAEAVRLEQCHHWATSWPVIAKAANTALARLAPPPPDPVVMDFVAAAERGLTKNSRLTIADAIDELDAVLPREDDPPQYSRIVRLKFWGDMSFARIAAELGPGWTARMVTGRYEKACERLGEKLKAFAEGAPPAEAVGDGRES